MKIVTQKELCNLLKVDDVFLWRCRKKGLPHLKIGSRLIRYDLDAVLKWFEKNSLLD